MTFQSTNFITKIRWCLEKEVNVPKLKVFDFCNYLQIPPYSRFITWKNFRNLIRFENFTLMQYKPHQSKIC